MSDLLRQCALGGQMSAKQIVEEFEAVKLTPENTAPEITPEMIEAGADVLLGVFGGGTTFFWSEQEVAGNVFRAMLAARK